MSDVSQSLMFLLAGLVCLGLARAPEPVFAKRLWIKGVLAAVIVAHLVAGSFLGWEIRAPLSLGGAFFLDLGSVALFICGVISLGRREGAARSAAAE